MTYELFCNFKTSYVMVYRQLLDESTIVQGNFKTSYVMVYLLLPKEWNRQTEFQNIICYGLS